MPQLADKVALVTGGSRGIGAATALRLAEEGADVALTYVNAADRAQEVVTAIEALGRRGVAIRADSADPAAVVGSVERTVAELGGLDILVNNAGVFPYGPIEGVTLEEIDRTLAVHVRAVFLATQAAVPHLGHGGRVISIGSCWASRVPVPDVTLYAMSKSALIGFTKGLAHDVAPKGITANIVDPGPTVTDMNPDGTDEAEEERLRTAAKVLGAGADTAKAVAFLAGPDAQWITGTSLAVDGGYTA
ncbi:MULTISPECIES: SDR family NAD(P)-dependent oxidoreductase [Streptomyces]|uniref:Short chain dehydrogenase n=1 Tax=Streptomyces griseus subsp. griseus (strain JCM 4626 / CBS 651.72 / NBRC 13350 / KCC S-0626 / ISP 5235) TaxID=455632 RepID=B1VYC7_STRGG|nr:SDR family oxidoreductase [Streptomyces griseus]MBW3707579.1 SDR family NAD(P)-dependent oxidoreductase [Streptomyces griseus]BAG21912.1 putative short chain dehydrogenase [Streptomyces griseus subsp. griseus NBRC 13350]SEE60272.1 NAD(P)-dependent dehydrogenase, short-chain alcohol dehydrogenase family [Streptomyces griseus]SQA25955.1 short chain dehydrogenase [Streptomyces griseus]